MRWLFDLGKYKTIVISVALFLIFDLGVLVLNFYISAQIRNDSVGVNLSGRQRMLSQRMAKEMFLIEEAHRNGTPADETIDSLKQSSALFQKTLTAFENGGDTTGGDGSPVQLKRVEVAEGRAAIERAKTIWSPIQQRLAADLELPAAESAAAIAALLPSYKQNNGPLLKEMNNLTTELERDATRKATLLRMVQVVGITLATINFFIILFHFVRQLRANDEQLAKAKRETDNILATVDQGLFLIGKDGMIGQQQSQALARIINEENVAGRKLSDVMARTLKDNSRALLDDFIGILFNNRVKEKLIADINPLNQVEMNFERDDGRVERRYLNFNFKRVSDSESGEQDALLAVVTDVTMQTELSIELERSRAQREEDVEAIVSLLHVPPDRLQAFLVSCRQSLNAVNQALSTGTTSGSGLHQLLSEIGKPIHRIKGDAASLKLDTFERWAHSFEDDIAFLRDKPKLIGNDLLPLTVKLKSVYEQLDNVRGLVDRLGQLRGSLDESSAPAAASSVQHVVSGIEAVALAVAERNGKRVSLTQTGDFAELPPHLRDDVESIVVQLIRNAVFHGIETPAERATQRKSAQGRIWVDISDIGTSYEVSVRDDGAGVDYERIREKAVAFGLLTPEQARNAEQKVLFSLMFRPDFTTADEATQDAGRGAGLGLVKDLIARQGGKVAFETQKAKGTHFRLQFPKRADFSA
jgi:two-component system, chemotaxis family, sensor kinase CheA